MSVRNIRRNPLGVALKVIGEFLLVVIILIVLVRIEW